MKMLQYRQWSTDVGPAGALFFGPGLAHRVAAPTQAQLAEARADGPYPLTCVGEVRGDPPTRVERFRDRLPALR